jgi:hypothetical protein
MLGPQWDYDPDEAHATEIEVRFVAEGPHATRVELVHSGFDGVPGGAEIRVAVGRPNGWGGLLELYSEAARS